MGNPYSTQTIANYNTSPPINDGSAVATNQLDWDKHKDKLADPIKTLSESINTEALAAFGKLYLNNSRAISTNDSQVADDERKLISCTNTITYTLLPVATAGDGFIVAVFNAGTGVITIEGDTSETINGELNATLPNQYDVILLRCDGSTWNIIHTKSVTNITLDTEQATTSGTTIDFTGIPAGTKRVSVMLDGVNTGGTSEFIIQLGDSGGFETTGYISGLGTDASPTGFLLSNNASSSSDLYGLLTFHLMDTNNTWVMSGNIWDTQITETTYECAGRKSLSAELTQLRLTTISGNTFSAGAVNIAYE